ncbi:MAG: hypothetical protein ACHQHP_01005 [Bacteroidia bacterium]
MKNKEEIKEEIYSLAKKISETTSEDSLFESARELYEKTILLKHHTPAIEPLVAVKQEEKTVVVTEESIKPEPQPVKQVAIDLFSTETVQAETSSVLVEKPAPKELKEQKRKIQESVSEKLQHKKISDLKAAIGINEKFQFINELFEGNMKEYNVAIDQINNFSSHPEAESYLANLREVYKWNEENPIAANFLELVERRFL